MLRRSFTLLAGLSLAAALLLVAIWSSRLLPPRFWIGVSWTPIHQPDNIPFIECGRNMIVITRVQPDGQAILGPSITDAAAVKSFRHEFGGLVDQHTVAYDTLVGPAFAHTPDRRIKMVGTTALYLVPYWLPIVLFSILPACKWLPPVARWVESRAGGPRSCPTCGCDLIGNDTGPCPGCGAAVSQRTE
jgi:hypothetical protein